MQKRIELTIARDYCPTWGVWEGVREFIQNWMDARDADGGDGHSAAHSANVVTLWNPRARLDVSKVVLVGQTTKPGTAARGQFGEGLKIGMLALARLGCRIRVECDTDVFEAILSPSRQFEGEVLTIIRWAAVTPVDGVLVSITGVSAADWADIHGRILWEGSDFTLMPDRPGRIFVKDIWVQDAPAAYGYNLGNVSVDRDRRLVGSFDLKYYTAMALAFAWSKGRLGVGEILGVLTGSTIEAEFLPNMLDDSQRLELVDCFRERHGADAIPVANDVEGARVEHMGLTPTIQPKPLCEAIAQTILRARDRELLEWVEVPTTETERQTFDRAAALVELTAPVKIVRFKGERTAGMTDGRTIFVSVCMLADVLDAVKVLVEEQAHIDSAAGDGSLSHKHAIHDRYCSILRKVMA